MAKTPDFNTLNVHSVLFLCLSVRVWVFGREISALNYDVTREYKIYFLRGEPVFSRSWHKANRVLGQAQLTGFFYSVVQTENCWLRARATA
jgi:hypothetical protein